MLTFTHFKNQGDGKTTLFNIERCETCNRVVQSPNAVGGIEADIPKYISLGMKEWTEELPSETYLREDNLGCACYGCNCGIDPNRV